MEHTPKIALLLLPTDSVAHKLDITFEDAEFVKRAVNSHYKMLETLEELLEVADTEFVSAAYSKANLKGRLYQIATLTREAIQAAKS